MSNAAPEDRPPLVVVGGLHVDELLWPDGPLIERASNPVRRERRAGGVGANVARAAAREGGSPVVLVAALGDDGAARWLADVLVADGVDVRARTLGGRESGCYTVVHDEHGELFVGLADTGLAEALTADAVRERLDGPGEAALVLDANLDSACLEGLAAGGAARPLVALAVSPAKAPRLAPCLPSLDLLFCNRREAGALGRLAPDAPIGALGDALVAAGCRGFVLSDGAEAVLVHALGERTSVAVPPVEVTGSVNGAGDALAGATLARWLAHGDLVAAVREAGVPAAAAIVTGRTANASADTSLRSPAETPR